VFLQLGCISAPELQCTLQGGIPLANSQKLLQFSMVLVMILSLLAPAALQAAAGPDPLKLSPQLIELASEAPDQLVRVIVQKADQTDRAAQAVQALDGEVLKDLDLINAFAAQVPAATLKQLGAEASVNWVYLDAPVVSTALPSTPLISADVVWKYLDNGSNQGTNWTKPNFDDSAWASGPGQLGYGDGDETTVLSYGPDPANKHITTYFRHEFEVAEPTSFDLLILRYEVDDGAVFYLNDQEVHRFNMPGDSLSYTTLAVSDGYYDHVVNEARVSAGYLVEGTNILAVEVHQGYPDSSDLSFALEMEGTAGTDSLIAANADWKYLDNGTDQGTGWRAVGFNDSPWQSGPAQLGYGDWDEMTVVDFGPDETNKYITTYFRHEFSISDPGIYDFLTLRFKADDGAVIYLNGQEVQRANLPEGTIEYGTLALIDTNPDDLIYEAQLETAGLVAGTNVVAVEIHQADVTSSDISMELELFGIKNIATFRETLGADAFNELGLEGDGITVAVIDSGISTHQDFESRIVHRQVFNPAANGNNDYYGHGTHVAGIIGGSGFNGSEYFRGIAPMVQMLGLRVSDANGMGYESDVVDALQWVSENKDLYNIRVVNMSLNSTLEASYDDSAMNVAGEMLWLSGVVVVVSAGNTGVDGPYNSAKTAPANDPFFIAVGASDEIDNSDRTDDTIASFSAYGITPDGFLKPDIIAPGYNIIAPLSSDSAWNVSQKKRLFVNGGYIRLSGTSMSAPMVAGTVALLLEDEPNLTPDQVKYRLLNTATTITDSQGTGWPYLDTYAAVNGTSTEAANQGLRPHMLLARMAMMAYWTNSNGGDEIDWGSVNWDSVNWDSVNWDSVNWDSVNWDSVNWDSVNWDSVNWDSVNWDSVNWDSVNWDSVNWDSVNWDSVNWNSGGLNYLVAETSILSQGTGLFWGELDRSTMRATECSVQVTEKGEAPSTVCPVGTIFKK
jgi:serine protease AprX